MTKTKKRSAQRNFGATKTPLNPVLKARAKLEEAERLRQSSQFDRAQLLCEAILKEYPDYVGALHTLGLVLADKHDYARALPPLAQAAMLNPRDWKTLTALSGVYLRLGAGVMAARTLEQALARKPNEPGILTTLGDIYREEQEYAAGAEAFQKAISLDPSLHAARLGFGLCAMHLGELGEAAAAFERLIAEGQCSMNVLYFLGELPAALISSDLLTLIEKCPAPDDLSQEEFVTLTAFTRAAALDKAKQYEGAWYNLVVANSQLCEKYRKDCKTLRKFGETMLSRANKAKPEAPPCEQPSTKGTVSLFILGPSRSGKTTLERLLGAHQQIKRGFENPILENAVRQAFQTAGLPTRTRMVELPPSLDALCREFYSEELAERANKARVLTNTIPIHITSVLRIAAVLPEARFIFVKRHPDDIAIRIFMRRYQTGHQYGYDISTIDDHVAWYYDMIDVLSEKVPGRSIVLNYEDVIADPPAALDAAVGLCGLAPADAASLPQLGDDRGCGEHYRNFMRPSAKV